MLRGVASNVVNVQSHRNFHFQESQEEITLCNLYLKDLRLELISFTQLQSQRLLSSLRRILRPSYHPGRILWTRAFLLALLPPTYKQLSSRWHNLIDRKQFTPSKLLDSSQIKLRFLDDAAGISLSRGLL